MSEIVTPRIRLIWSAVRVAAKQIAIVPPQVGQLRGRLALHRSRKLVSVSAVAVRGSARVPICITEEGGHDNFCTIGCTGRAMWRLGENAIASRSREMRRFVSLVVIATMIADVSLVVLMASVRFGGMSRCRGWRRQIRVCPHRRAMRCHRATWHAVSMPRTSSLTAEMKPLVSPLMSLWWTSICNGDDDWYRLAVPANQASWSMSITALRAGVDIDIYLYDAFAISSARTAPDEVNEVIELIGTGSYYSVSINSIATGWSIQNRLGRPNNDNETTAQPMLTVWQNRPAAAFWTRRPVRVVPLKGRAASLDNRVT